MMSSKNSKLGLFDSVYLLVGGMIGSAIFSLSGITILQAGLILLAYGLQTVELAFRYPQCGGIFNFEGKDIFLDF